MKKRPLFGLKDNTEESDKLWTVVDSTESVSDGIMVDSFNWNHVDILLIISDSSTLGISDKTVLGGADYSKFGE